MLKKTIVASFLSLMASIAYANEGQSNSSFDPDAYVETKPLPKEIVNHIRREAKEDSELVNIVVEEFFKRMGRIPAKNKLKRAIVKKITGEASGSIGEAAASAWADAVAERKIRAATEIYNQNLSN